MKTLLVDLDDTLLDYTGGVEDSWREACVALAHPAGVDVEALVAALVRARRWLWSDAARHRAERMDMPGAWRKIAEHALAAVDASDARLAVAIAEDFAARRWRRMDLFPGVIVALGKLRERGVRLGLVTNGDRRQQRRKVEHYGLASFFDVILIEGEFGSGKPDESVYRHVLEALAAKASDAWMVGDHLEWDVAAPQRLGLRGAWVDVEGRGLPADALARPDLILRSFTEIVDLVEARDDGDGTSSRAAGRGESRWN